MVVKTFVCNMLDENCSVVSDDSRECVIIDCGAFTDEEKRAIVDYITSENLKPVHLIATHGHLDHNFGNKMVYDTYSLRVEVGSADVAMIGNARKHAKSFYHYDLGYDLPPVGNTIADGDIITFGNHLPVRRVYTAKRKTCCSAATRCFAHLSGAPIWEAEA